MKKKAMMCMAAALCIVSGMTAYAAPETMPDGTLFDPVYYAEKNSDIAAAVGTDTSALYQHYKLYGAGEGRAAYDTIAVETSNAEQVQPQETVKKLLKKKSNYLSTGALDGFDLYEYDTQGNMVRELSYNDGNMTREELYSYDNRGNLIKEWVPGSLIATVYSYDSQGNKVRRQAYDRNGINCWDEKFSYDNQGNLVEDLTLHYGEFCVKSIYNYDNQGNLIEELGYSGIYASLSSRYLYTYDAQGNLIKKVREQSGTICDCYLYNYDNRGNVIEEQYVSSGKFIHDIRYTYEYDPQGNLVRKDEYKYTPKDNDSGTELSKQQTYYYDADGNILREESSRILDFSSDRSLHITTYVVYEY